MTTEPTRQEYHDSVRADIEMLEALLLKVTEITKRQFSDGNFSTGPLAVAEMYISSVSEKLDALALYDAKIEVTSSEPIAEIIASVQADSESRNEEGVGDEVVPEVKYPMAGYL